MLERTGVPERAQIDGVFPSEERLARGPVAVIECFERIPCNPCAMACPKGAILEFQDINDLPVLDYDKCNGCALCLMKCPGLAIMVVDMTYSPDRALIKVAYEFRPLPEKGQMVTALDREGSAVAKAEVVGVMLNSAMVPIVSIAVDKGLAKTVRNFSISAPETSIVCRCSDLDLEEIRQLIREGYTSVDELKRMARLGMGPCQGRTCVPIVLGELSRHLGRPVAELSPGTYRPVVKAIKLGDLADSEN